MTSGNETQELVPSFRVQVNGSDLPPQAVADIYAVTVYEDLEVPGMFTLQMVNWDMINRVITWSDDELFAEGNAVSIQMGYVDHLETVLVGEITGIEPEFSAGAMPMLTVRGHDRRHRLLRGRVTRSFSQMKDSDIASQIAGELGLTAEVEDTGVTLEYVLQHNQTNMEFLQERARRIGYELLVEDRTLFFRPLQHATGEVLTLARDGSLIEFFPRLSTLTQVSQVAVRGWDHREKVAIVGQAVSGDEGTQMGGTTSGPAVVDAAFGAAIAASVDQAIFSQAEADQIARGQFTAMALAYIDGEGTCIGQPDLRAGTVIKLEGLGQRFSGLYYVIATIHTYTPSRGYRTMFTVRRNAT